MEMCDDITNRLYSPESYWKTNILGHSITVSRSSMAAHEGMKNLTSVCSTWLRSHEDAQVMLASVLVVFGIWWMVRTVLSLLINLLCPLIVVLFAVVCVPQLRAPLLGQNYPALASLVRSILLKLADNMKHSH